jgi:hypothetical protein
MYGWGEVMRPIGNWLKTKEKGYDRGFEKGRLKGESVELLSGYRIAVN